MTFIQTDAAETGAVCGPLFNIDGEVIGITRDLQPQRRVHGRLVSIPIDTALSVKISCRKMARYSQPHRRVGTGYSPAALSFGLSTHGALIVRWIRPVRAKAGLKAGDDHQRERTQRRSFLRPAGHHSQRLSPGPLGIWHDRKATEVNVKTVLLRLAKCQNPDWKQRGAQHARRSLANNRNCTPRAPLVEDVTGPALAVGLQPGDVEVNGRGPYVADLKRGVSGRACRLLVKREDCKSTTLLIWVMGFVV